MKKPAGQSPTPTAQKTETANRITANIIRVVNMSPGCVAYRCNNVGIWDAAKQVYRAGNTEKGLPDIWAVFKSRAVAIEVKAGLDKQSEHQKARQFEIEKAGGLYFVARSTDAFLGWFEQVLAT